VNWSVYLGWYLIYLLAAALLQSEPPGQIVRFRPFMQVVHTYVCHESAGEHVLYAMQLYRSIQHWNYFQFFRLYQQADRYQRKLIEVNLVFVPKYQ
jgi:hypothetical protein